VEVGAVVGRAELPPLTPAQAQSVRKARSVAGRISLEMSEAAERARQARESANLFMSQNPIQSDRFGLIPPSREDQPTPLVSSTPIVRSRNTTAPPSPYSDPFAGSNDPFAN
jgi:hypothetical protein